MLERFLFNTPNLFESSPIDVDLESECARKSGGTNTAAHRAPRIIKTGMVAP